MSKRVFISHAAKDQKLVDSFVDKVLILGLGINSNDIFCSSLSGMGIPSGTNFIDYIKGQIQQPEVVIVIFSNAYINSQFCLCELGATWAMTHRMLPLLVPPLVHADVKGVLTGIQVDRINEAEELNRFQEEICNILKPECKFSRWERKRDDFIELSKEIIARNGANKEKSKELIALEKKYKEVQDDIRAYEEEIERKDQIIAKLKDCKNRDEVEEILNDFKDESEKFEELVSKVNEALKKLPRIVAYVLYKELYAKSEVVFSGFEDKHLLDYAVDATENGYLRFYEPCYSINEEDIRVTEAINSLRNLNRFLTTEISESFYEKLFNDIGYKPDLKNKRFWKDHFPYSDLL